MLWLYVNEIGAIECSVNVGYKIRQGDAFDVFVVVWGMNGEADGQEDAQPYNLSYVKYINPTMRSFSGPIFPQTATLKFELGSPSQVNSHFIGGEDYHGFLAHVPAQSTQFNNGGNIGLEIGMLSADGQRRHAETANVFVEPTYGSKPTLITESDYAMLLDLIREAGFTLSFAMEVAEDNGVSAVPPSGDPIIVLSKSQLAFVSAKLEINWGSLSDSQHAVDGTEGDGYATVAYFRSSNIALKRPAVIFGVDSSGDRIEFRMYGAANADNVINLDVKMQSGHSGTSAVSVFGTCQIDAEYLDWNYAGQAEATLITNVLASADTVGPESDASVTATIVKNEDGNSATLVFGFSIPKGDKGEQGDQGPQGDPATNALYFKVDENGHLIMYYANSVAEPAIHLVTEENYASLGVSEDMVGHLVFIYGE